MLMRIEVVSARELGYIGKPDEFHIEKASEIKAKPRQRN
jgi:hypothetical protein